MYGRLPPYDKHSIINLLHTPCHERILIDHLIALDLGRILGFGDVAGKANQGQGVSHQAAGRSLPAYRPR